MDKFNQILAHPLYQMHRKAIEALERDRQFCRHDTQHFLDVARIGYILVLEDGLKIDKEVVYAYAFLHDIGRDVEYNGGEAHDLASIKLAKIILSDTSYSEDEQRQIIGAIEHHRDRAIADSGTFEGFMYQADKKSRACHMCQAEPECHWAKNKKNMMIEV